MTGLRADAVLFDKDGTLFDFNATWVAWVEAMLARWSAGDAGLADRLAMALDFDRAARVFRPGSVVIAHLNHPRSGTAAGLGAAIPAMLDGGWEFVLPPPPGAVARH